MSFVPSISVGATTSPDDVAYVSVHTMAASIASASASPVTVQCQSNMSSSVKANASPYRIVTNANPLPLFPRKLLGTLLHVIPLAQFQTYTFWHASLYLLRMASCLTVEGARILWSVCNYFICLLCA